MPMFTNVQIVRHMHPLYFTYSLMRSSRTCSLVVSLYTLMTFWSILSLRKTMTLKCCLESYDTNYTSRQQNVNFTGKSPTWAISYVDKEYKWTKTRYQRKWPTPTSNKELQRLLGFVNFYWRFNRDYRVLASLLMLLLWGKPKKLLS